MSRFVDACRKEWNRLGVPEPVANEMAADLAADLAEAEAEGAAPENVLGNGVFDARSFAASWATARGVVPREHRTGMQRRWRAAMAVASGAVSFVAGVVGLAILGHGQQGSMAAVAFSKPTRVPLLGPRSVPINPQLPGRLLLFHGGAVAALGVILLGVGLVGLGFTLWLWKPWTTWRRRGGFDESVGLPSYL